MSKDNNKLTEEEKEGKADQPKTPQKSQDTKEDTREILEENNKTLKATRIARVAATVGTIIVAAVTSPIKALESTAKLFAPIDNLSEGETIKEKGAAPPNAIDRGLDRLLKPIPGGSTISKGIQKGYKTLGTRPVSIGIKVAGIAASLAFAPVGLPIALTMAGVSLAATGFNIVKETLEVRAEKLRNAEKKSLENIKEAKQNQQELIVKKAQEIKSKSSPDLDVFLAQKVSEIYRKPSEEMPEKPFTNTYLKEFMKVCRDSASGFASTLLVAASAASVTGWIAAGASMISNFTGETDNKLVRMKQNKIRYTKLII